MEFTNANDMSNDNRYPRPLYQRAVNAYLREFCEKHDYDIHEVHVTGEPYPLYDFDDFFWGISLDDIRLDIDGLDTKTGGHIDTTADDLGNWLTARRDGDTINYKNYILATRL